MYLWNYKLIKIIKINKLIKKKDTFDEGDELSVDELFESLGTLWSKSSGTLL